MLILKREKLTQKQDALVGQQETRTEHDKFSPKRKRDPKHCKL